jgi:hypothetical protein
MSPRVEETARLKIVATLRQFEDLQTGRGSCITHRRYGQGWLTCIPSTCQIARPQAFTQRHPCSAPLPHLNAPYRLLTSATSPWANPGKSNLPSYEADNEPPSDHIALRMVSGDHLHVMLRAPYRGWVGLVSDETGGSFCRARLPFPVRQRFVEARITPGLRHVHLSAARPGVYGPGQWPQA